MRVRGNARAIFVNLSDNGIRAEPGGFSGGGATFRSWFPQIS